MSRSFSTSLLGTLYALSASDPIYALVTVTHSDLSTKRYVRNSQDVTSNSNVFTAASFDVNLPEEREDAPPRASLVIDVVDQAVVSDLLSINSPATVLIQLVMASSPDTVIASWTLSARSASWDALSMTIDLDPDPVLDEPYPGPTFNPRDFPGLFD